LRRRRLGCIVALLLVLSVVAALAVRYYWLHRYDALIERTAIVYRLDPKLVRAVVHQESYFYARAASQAGAKGLMQVTEPVVVEWRRERAYDALSPEARKRALAKGTDVEGLLNDAELNLNVGCWYLAKLLERYRGEFDALTVALAAYNAGPTNADRWLAAMPRRAEKSARAVAFLAAVDYPETRRYVVEVRERYQKG
jgi:soluble lytic murein transglycosylase